MRRNPSPEFRAAFPTCPVEEVSESDLLVVRFTGWLDVVKFDEWLSAKSGYNPDVESTLAFVERVFGAKAAEVLRNEV